MTWILTRMQKLDGWKTLDRLSRKLLPLIVPWILVPSGVSVFAAFLHACVNNSLEEFLTFVFIPLAIWMGFSRGCSSRVYGPTFAPSSIAALIAVVVGTHYFRNSAATSQLFNLIFGSACAIVSIMFYRLIVSDPGRIVADSSACLSGSQQLVGLEQSDAIRYPDRCSTVIQVEERRQQGMMCRVCSVMQPLRSKHCKYCNICVERFDHHCPAVYNCVGRKNHVQFLGMLVAFIVAEILYLYSCLIFLQVLGKSQTGERNLYNDELMWEKTSQVLNRDPWVLSTAVFVGMEALWQVALLIFHIYCACSNLTSDEMFHWEKYDGFYVETLPDPAFGRPFVGKRFVNPYTKGVEKNLISFFQGYS